MKRAIVTALALGGLLGTVPARADDGAFCSSLKAAWTAGRNNPASFGGLTMADASKCASSDGDLRCTWVLEDREKARALYERFKVAAVACLAPVGLKPVFKTVEGVETTSLETESDDPDVAIFYPGTVTVTVSIITTE